MAFPAYPKWRILCGLSEINTWDDLDDVIDEDSLNRIRDIYDSVDDIDLYTGALSEVPLGAGRGILGPVLTCLISDQFVRIKRGDRFWYETGEQPQAFTQDQLQQIRNTTLAGIICANTDTITAVQKYVMRAVSDKNPTMQCTDIEVTDFSYWKEEIPDDAKKPPSSTNARSKSFIHVGIGAKQNNIRILKRNNTTASN